MKELSIEEKAKRYDEAYKKVAVRFGSNIADEIFLKESEDEKIRKGLIDAFNTAVGNDFLQRRANLHHNKVIAWLEKQGEQKPTETADLRTWKYIVDAVLTEREDIGQYIDNPWTTEVAKKLQKRFGSIEQKPTIVPKFRVGDIVKDIEDGEVFTIRTVTKDKYIYTDDTFDWIKDQDTFILVEQKPVKTPQWMIDFLNEHRSKFGHAVDHDERRDIEGKLLCIKQWLKGNPNIEQKPVESEPFEIEDGKYYYCIHDYYSGGNKRASKGDVVQALRGMSMMGLGVRANEYFLPVNNIEQKSVEWSEEDESMRTRCIEALMKCYMGELPQTVIDEVEWLKSLRPQSQWKPSEEQIKAIKEAACYSSVFSEKTIDNLILLSKQLKKLREA